MLPPGWAALEQNLPFRKASNPLLRFSIWPHKQKNSTSLGINTKINIIKCPTVLTLWALVSIKDGVNLMNRLQSWKLGWDFLALVTNAAAAEEPHLLYQRKNLNSFSFFLIFSAECWSISNCFHTVLPVEKWSRSLFFWHFNSSSYHARILFLIWYFNIRYIWTFTGQHSWCLHY